MRDCPGLVVKMTIEIENALLQLFQVRVQLESGLTSSESSHEDVDASVIRLILLEIGVDDFERIIIGESYLPCD